MKKVLYPPPLLNESPRGASSVRVYQGVSGFIWIGQGALGCVMVHHLISTDRKENFMISLNCKENLIISPDCWKSINFAGFMNFHRLTCFGQFFLWEIGLMGRDDRYRV